MSFFSFAKISTSMHNVSSINQCQIIISNVNQKKHVWHLSISIFKKRICKFVNPKILILVELLKRKIKIYYYTSIIEEDNILVFALLERVINLVYNKHVNIYSKSLLEIHLQFYRMQYY